MNHIKLAIEKEKNRIERIRSGKTDPFGVRTGFPTVDRILWGLQGGRYYIVAARPGVGKTALAINILGNAMFEENRTCAFFSLEMPENDIAQRLISWRSGVDNFDLKSSKRLTESQIEKVEIATQELSKKELYNDDSSKQTVETIIRQSRELKAKGKLDLVIVDYIGLITPMQKSGKRHEDIAEISRCIKVICKDLDVPVVILCQLDRGLDREDTEPTLSHLRESGALEQDADVVMFIHPKTSTFEPEYKADLIIAKNRHGQKAKIKVNYRGCVFKFTEEQKILKSQVKQVVMDEKLDIM